MRRNTLSGLSTCMWVRSMSVGCVSRVAAIAATVPDEKLIAACGAPCCNVDQHVSGTPTGHHTRRISTVRGEAGN